MSGVDVLERVIVALLTLVGIALAAIVALLFAPLQGVHDWASTLFVPVGGILVLLVALILTYAVVKTKLRTMRPEWFDS
jgi:hypothetical protein